ncbi:MAG: type II secretion system secretin GspD, partial [Deltaproteobacteria bacterium]|nr:type II secretion system secretin GspD [Deltaproteobacteria bacterium]
LFSATLYCLPVEHAEGARVAGDSKVTSSAPEDDPSGYVSPDTSVDPGIESEGDETGETLSEKPDEDVTPGNATEDVREIPVVEKGGGLSAKKSATKSADALKNSRQGNGYIYIDFKADSDLLEFIQYISELTGRNFLIDSNVKGKVTIISPTKITIEEAYKVFESVLEINGYTTIPAGQVTKIVPTAEARTKDIDTHIGLESTDPEDRIVTQLIPLSYANADQIKSDLAALISKNGIMSTYAPTNMLIVIDYLSNINRLLEIIAKIDVEGTSEQLSVTPLKYSGAESMAKTLTSVFKATTAKTAKETSTSVIIVAETRTNSIITLASELDTLNIKKLIDLLDKETPKGEGNIHFYPLQNHDAEELAKVLTAIPTESSSSTAAKEGVKETAVVLSEDVKIIADKATNSLVIIAGKDDYIVLEEIIQKLDMVKKMVYIEALIMEVSMTKQFELGVQWYGGEKTGSIDGKDVVTFGSSTSGTGILPGIDTSTGQLSFSSGLSFGVLGDTITIGDLTFPSIAAVIRAYSTDTEVNILSTPQVMTLDNEEAMIKVAENVPVLTSQQTTASNYDYSNYDREDVGVTLKITPQINQERFVKLKIEQTVDQLTSEEVIGLYTTLTREINATVRIKDGQTVVIGGLIDETKKSTNYKVPVLGSIPILGYLFRSKAESVDKKNLYIFITPHIIETVDEGEELHENKMGQMDEVREGLISMNKGKFSQTEDERLCDLGFSYLQVKDYDKAAEKYEKALKINPDNPLALLNMGIIYEKKKEYDKAIEMYEKVTSLNVDDRVYDVMTPVQSGQKATDIARENLENLKKE